MSEDKLKAMRENLDKIDIEIQTLLIQRAKISLEVRATKQSDPLKIRPGREAEIIRNLIWSLVFYLFAEKACAFAYYISFDNFF